MAFDDLSPRSRELMIDLCRHMVDGKYTEFYAAFAMGGSANLILVGLKDMPQLNVTEWKDKFDTPDIDDLGDAGYVRLRSAGKGALAGALRARARSEYARFLKEAADNGPDPAQARSGAVAVPAAAEAKEGRNDLPDTGSQPVPARMLLNGRYEVLETLGRGAMGIVYHGRDTQLGKDVAIKFLHEDRAKDTKEVQRFKREVLILRDIRHPNVCHIYDYGEAEGRPFYAMKYLQGHSLAEELKLNGALKWDAFISMVRQIGSALTAVHATKALHRDVKPGNVMVCSDGKDVLMDFGLAKEEGGVDLTGGGAAMGTPLYISPEQCLGSPLDERADLYSFAGMCFHALTGRPVFHGKGPQELVALHVSREPDLNDPLLTPALRGAFARAMKKKPSERQGSVAQFVEELLSDVVADASTRTGPAVPSRPEVRPEAEAAPLELETITALFAPEGHDIGSPNVRGFYCRFDASLTSSSSKHLGGIDVILVSWVLNSDVSAASKGLLNLCEIVRPDAYENEGRNLKWSLGELRLSDATVRPYHRTGVSFPPVLLPVVPDHSRHTADPEDWAHAGPERVAQMKAMFAGQACFRAALLAVMGDGTPPLIHQVEMFYSTKTVHVGVPVPRDLLVIRPSERPVVGWRFEAQPK